MKKNSKAVTIIKKVVNVILTIFLIFSLCTTILAISSNSNGDGVPNFLGYSLMAVESDSMEPTIMTGDLIIVDLYETEEEKQSIQVNDIITFLDTDLSGEANEVVLNTHRVVELVTNDQGELISCITKGDNELATTDTTQRAVADIRGLYMSADGSVGGTRLSGLGYFLNFLFTSTGFLVCVLIPLILVFAYEIYSFVKAAIKIKNKDKKVITAEDEEAIKKAAIEEYLRQNAAAAPGEAASDSTQAPSDAGEAAPAEPSEEQN